MRNTSAEGEQPTGREEEGEEEKKKQKEKRLTQLKFTRSLPALGLSKLNKTTRAATYQTCLHARTFFFICTTTTTPPPHVCECDREASQCSMESNIRKTSSMLRIRRLSVIKSRKNNFGFPNGEARTCETVNTLLPLRSCLSLLVCLLSNWLSGWCTAPPLFFAEGKLVSEVLAK